MTRTRCQCPHDSVDHAWGQCKWVGYIHVRRGKTELWLCADCVLSGDVRLNDEWEEV